jgi:hypothetical protein
MYRDRYIIAYSVSMPAAGAGLTRNAGGASVSE